MFTHFTLGTNDRPRAEAFYAAVTPPLGLKLVKSVEAFFAYGVEEQAPPLLVINPPFDSLPATWSNGFHIALLARDAAAVQAFHAAALAAGGHDEGAPGLRPAYAADYYAAYVRDPDGNKLQAVHYRNGRKAGPCGEVVSHITLGSNDLERSRGFYQGLLSVLGVQRLSAEETPGEDLAFGLPGTRLPIVFIQKPFDGRPATWGNGAHVSFDAPSHAAVRAFHEAALALGGSDEGAPGLRPRYHAAYYAAYVRDPDGNKLQAYCRKSE
ncbi:MAG: VOC family protein [Kiloniellales bacterium]|nr:VOC family protein [Kiloniellales bacterium]